MLSTPLCLAVAALAALLSCAAPCYSLPTSDQRLLRASLASFAQLLAADESIIGGTPGAASRQLIGNFTSSLVEPDVTYWEEQTATLEAMATRLLLDRRLPRQFAHRLLQAAAASPTSSADFVPTTFAVEVEAPLCRYRLLVGAARRHRLRSSSPDDDGSLVQVGILDAFVSCDFVDDSSRSGDCDGEWTLPWRSCSPDGFVGPKPEEIPALTAALRREAAARIVAHPVLAKASSTAEAALGTVRRRSRRSADSKASLRQGVSGFAAKFQLLSSLVQSQQSSLATPIRRITSRGFDFFSQSASLQAIEGVELGQYPAFVEFALNMIDVSASMRQSVREAVFDIVPWLGHSEWHDFGVLFRSGSGGSTKYVSILAHNGGPRRGFDFVIADFQTSFSLAPDLLVVERKSSSLWGAFGSSETVIHRVPASIKKSDLDVLLTFFDLAAFRRFAQMLNVPLAGTSSRHRRSAAVGYVAAIQAGIELYSKFAKAFKTKKTSQIVGKIIGKGFDYFSMRSRAHVISRMNPDFLPRFLGMLDRLYGFPAKHLPEIKAVMQMVEFVGHQDWNKNDFLFDVGSGGQNGWVTILSNQNEDGTYNFLIANVQQKFRLAPDVLIIKESKSVLGGIYESEKYKFHRIPRSITEEDLQALTAFFNIITFKRFGLQLSVDTSQLDP